MVVLVLVSIGAVFAVSLAYIAVLVFAGTASFAGAALAAVQRNTAPARCLPSADALWCRSRVRPREPPLKRRAGGAWAVRARACAGGSGRHAPRDMFIGSGGLAVRAAGASAAGDNVVVRAPRAIFNMARATHGRASGRGRHAQARQPCPGHTWPRRCRPAPRMQLAAQDPHL